MSDFELEAPEAHEVRVVHIKMDPPSRRPRAAPAPQQVTLRDGVHDAIPLGGDLRRDRALVLNFVDWTRKGGTP
jgi:hypothetical protein